MRPSSRQLLKKYRAASSEDLGKVLERRLELEAAVRSAEDAERASREAWEKTLETVVATYWTRSRKGLWVKGESTGNIQKVKEILVDCDLDTVVFKIEQVGGSACHEGYPSCFFRRVEKDGSLTVIEERVFDPATVYKK